MKAASPYPRVLSLYVTTRGYCFTLFESPFSLFDWGIKRIERGDKNKESLASIEHVIRRFQPHVLVIEDTSEPSSRRSLRARKLYRDIEKLADARLLDTYCYPHEVVMKCFGDTPPKTKHEVSVRIAEAIPALANRVPPKRKIWLPQDPRQSLFDAAALGITFYTVHGDSWK